MCNILVIDDDKAILNMLRMVLTELGHNVETAEDGKVFEIDAIKTNPPGTDGKMHIIDTVGLFTVRGRWAVRGVLDMSNGNIFKGSWCGFPVDE